jgi:hypothetical protein
MTQFVTWLKENIAKSIALTLAAFLIGIFSATLAIPKEVKEIKEHQERLESQHMALSLQV